MSVPVRDSQPHQRKLIRSRIKQLLHEGTDLAEKFFCSRPNPAFLNELPIGLIYFTDEEASFQKTSPRIYTRHLTLTVEVLHNIETERENALDDYFDSRAFEIEHAILDDRFLGLPGIIQDSELKNTEVLNLTFEGDRTIASMRIFWDITYVSDFNYQGNLDEFLKFNSKYNLGVGASIAQAEDMVTIRTN